MIHEMSRNQKKVMRMAVANGSSVMDSKKDTEHYFRLGAVAIALPALHGGGCPHLSWVGGEMEIEGNFRYGHDLKHTVATATRQATSMCNHTIRMLADAGVDMDLIRISMKPLSHNADLELKYVKLIISVK